jgi:predicted O-linked N-acetylglucosamine transferase (SPINDLY family)
MFVKDCFLCFDPAFLMDGARPTISAPPILSYSEKEPTGADMPILTIGCFGRADKLSGATVLFYNDILLRNPRVRIAMKSRGFRTVAARQMFLARMVESVRDRVFFFDYSATYKEHLASYNRVDVSIDTFPYSGTTTCCDSLLMGTEMFTLRDETHYFHAHNVASSILRNVHADMEFFVLRDVEDIHAKIVALQLRSDGAWRASGERTRKRFLGGVICNKVAHARNMETVLQDIYAHGRA